MNGVSRSAQHTRSVSLLVISLLVILVASTAWQVVEVYQTSRDAIKSRLEVNASVLAEHADRTLGEVVQILDAVQYDLKQRGGYQHLSEKELYDLLKPYARRAPQISSLFVVSADGALKCVTLGYPTKQISLKDRDFYLHHRDNPSPEPYISRSYKSRVDTVWRFSVSRRLDHADGSYAGMLAISLPVDYFHQFFQGLHSLPTERISLLRQDGYPQVIFPADDALYADNLKGSELFGQYLNKQHNGGFLGQLYHTDKLRQIAFHHMESAPLIATLSVESSAVLAPWRKRAAERIAITLLACGTILWLARRLSQQVRQSHQDLELLVDERTRDLVDTSLELAKNEQRLHALLDISQYQAKNIQELLDYALQKVIEITQSRFGYIYHYHEEQQEFILNSWSKEVMPACAVADPQTVYHLEKTGIWGEAVRQRRPILINDYAAADPLKKGYPEGHVHLSRFLTVPLFDSEHSIVAVVGVANKELPYSDQDMQQLELMMSEVWRITKRLELEMKLIHAGHEWQTTFDSISDSVSLIDADQQVLRCNLASTRLFKQDFKDIIGQHCWQLVHGTDHPIADCPMKRALQSCKTESQLIFENDRWLYVTVDPLLDEAGKVTGAVHIVRDETERVTADQALLELLSMLEAVQNELYVFRTDTLQFEYVNNSALKNLGYSMSQLLQMTPLDIKPFNRQEFIQLIAPLVSGEKQLLQFETTHQRADGSSYPVEVNLQIVTTHAGDRYLAVIHNSTERKQAAQSLREAHAQLLQNEKMASIGQLSAGIAHEINNPMGFINSNLSTLEKYIEKFDRYINYLEEALQESGSQQRQQAAAQLRSSLKLDFVQRDIRQLLDESSDGAERVMKIVQDLKTFSRSDTSQVARADLHQCLDSTINIIWNQIKYVAELRREYGDLPKVICNVQQINQVFMNLLINATHAIEEKGTEELGSITVRTWAENDSVFIAFSDTGCGIPEEVRSRIFDPFFTTKEVGKGTGLGLSISYDIIYKHGGELTVRSLVGQGTTFTVQLPISPPPPPRNAGTSRGLDD